MSFLKTRTVLHTKMRASKRPRFEESSKDLLNISFFSLPQDTVYEIFSFLERNDFPTLRQVSKQFKAIVDQSRFWIQRVDYHHLDRFLMGASLYQWRYKTLNIDMIPVTGTLTQSLEQINSLDWGFVDTLRIYLNDLRNTTGVYHFPQHLSHLTVANTSWIETSLLHLPSNLTYLKIFNSFGASKYGLYALPNSLRTLKLDGIDTSFGTIDGTLLPKKLETLSISGYTGGGTTAFLSGLSDLRKLTISSAEHLKFFPESFHSIANTLVKLTLSYCEFVTDKLFENIQFAKLQYLCVFNTSVTGGILKYLPKTLERLRIHERRTKFSSSTGLEQALIPTLPLSLKGIAYGSCEFLSVLEYCASQRAPSLLREALYRGHRYKIKDALERGIRGGSCPEHLQLIAAALGKDLHGLLYELNTFKQWKRFPLVDLLIVSIVGGRCDFVERLIDEFKFSPQARDEFSYSPLYFACVLGYTEMIVQFLNYGADVNFRNPSGITDFEYLCRHEFNLKTMQVYYALRKVGVKFSDFPEYVLLRACLVYKKRINNSWTVTKEELAHHLEFIFGLIEAKNGISFQDEITGFTPLHYLCKCNGWGSEDPSSAFSTCFKTLILNGANVNAWTKKGKTPLHFAVMRSPLSTEILLEKGANPNIATSLGRLTPLHFVSFKIVSKLYNRLAVAALLIANKDLDVNATTSLDETALYLACLNDKTDIVKQILSHPCSIHGLHIVTVTGQTLVNAAMFGSTAMLRLILSQGVDPNGTEKTRPLIQALLNDDQVRDARIKLLLEFGADPYRPDIYERKFSDFMRQEDIQFLMNTSKTAK